MFEGAVCPIVRTEVKRYRMYKALVYTKWGMIEQTFMTKELADKFIEHSLKTLEVVGHEIKAVER